MKAVLIWTSAILALGLSLAEDRVQKSSLIVTPDGWRSSANLSNTTVIMGQNGSKLIGFNRSSSPSSSNSSEHKCQHDRGSNAVKSDGVIGFDRIPVVDLNGTVRLLSDEIVPVSTINGDIIFTTVKALEPVPNNTDTGSLFTTGKTGNTTTTTTTTSIANGSLQANTGSDDIRLQSQQPAAARSLPPINGSTLSSNVNTPRSRPIMGPSPASRMGPVFPAPLRFGARSSGSAALPSSDRMGPVWPESLSDRQPVVAAPVSSTNDAAAMGPWSMLAPSAQVPDNDSDDDDDDDLKNIGDIILNEVLNPILSSTSLLTPTGQDLSRSSSSVMPEEQAQALDPRRTGPSGGDLILIPIDSSPVFQADLIIELDDQPDRYGYGAAGPVPPPPASASPSPVTTSAVFMPSSASSGLDRPQTRPAFTIPNRLEQQDSNIQGSSGPAVWLAAGASTTATAPTTGSWRDQIVPGQAQARTGPMLPPRARFGAPLEDAAAALAGGGTGPRPVPGLTSNDYIPIGIASPEQLKIQEQQRPSSAMVPNDQVVLVRGREPARPTPTPAAISDNDIDDKECSI